MPVILYRIRTWVFVVGTFLLVGNVLPAYRLWFDFPTTNTESHRFISRVWPAYRWWFNGQSKRFKASCIAASSAEMWERLDELTRQWLKMDRNNGDAWLLLAQAAQKLEDYELAADSLARLSDSDPKCILALVERVDLLLSIVNRPLEAVETCKRILSINESIPRAHEILIFFYSMSLQRQELRHYVRRSIELKCEPPDAYVFLITANTIKFSDGLDYNSLWLEQYPHHEPFLVAAAKHMTDNPLHSDEHTETTAADAEDMFRNELMDDYLKRFPENLEVLAYHFETRLFAGKADEVAKLLSKLPSTAEGDSRFWYYKGWYYYGRNQLTEAATALRKSLSLDPFDWRTRHQLAQVVRRLEGPKAAKTMVELAEQGKNLSIASAKLPNARVAGKQLLRRIANYVERCGDAQMARAIQNRLGSIPAVP